MNKAMLWVTFVLLGFLTVVSSINPDTSAVWLASSDRSFDLLRSGVMLVLLTLMFTNPPRNVLLRAVIGVMTVVFIGWSGYMTYEGFMQILDGIIFVAAGISALIAVLEVEQGQEQIVSPNFKKPANNA